MSAPNTTALSLELSYKLQDPVNIGTDEGGTFTANSRLTYLQAGRREIVNILRKFNKNVALIFPDYEVHWKNIIYSSSGITYDDNYTEIKKVFYAPESGQDLKLAIKLPTYSEYLLVSGKKNVFKLPTPTNRYWAVNSGKFYICPGNVDYTTLEAIAYKRYPDLSYSDNDITIYDEYINLLLNYAAYFAMMDRGKADLARSFQAQINQSLQINFRINLFGDKNE